MNHATHAALSGSIARATSRQDDDRFITVKELAHRAGIGRTLIYELLKEGMPAHRIRRARRFLWDEVKPWLEKRSKEPTPPQKDGP